MPTASYLLLVTFLVAAEPAKAVDYAKDVKPILTKYCVGCHEGDAAEGGLSLASFEDLLKGGANGVALVAKDSEQSRLYRVVAGLAEPKMPPEENEAPTAAEIAVLKRWIDEGAKGPDGAEPIPTQLQTPHIPPSSDVEVPIASVAYSPSGETYALARYKQVLVHNAKDHTLRFQLEDHPGKVTCVRYSTDGKWLLTGSGITGLFGEARIYNANEGKLIRRFQGHKDILYAAIVSPDGTMLATGSYDRAIILWEIKTGKKIHTLDGHNDAVYDLAFSPDGTVLASASGDTTVKLWRVADGERLDTLSQPLQEQYTVAFSPDGKLVAAGGVDNRIRVWQFISQAEPKINPILYARFGHEQAIVDLKFTPDGSKLISVSEDQTIKVWETQTFTELAFFDKQSAVPSEVAVGPEGKAVLVGRLDGSRQIYNLADAKTMAASAPKAAQSTVAHTAAGDSSMTELAEVEPNNTPEQATPLAIPAAAKGVIESAEAGGEDVDLYRITAKAGQSFVLETNAARSKSPLDSKIEVLTAAGEPIVRLNLQAVRDSYIKFRSIDSSSPDVRCQNWEEMQPNQYLYFNGEVCKIHRMPRGPDSGFRLYPEEGSRFCYFDTSATTHALHEPCYIVEPVAVGTPLIPNGLPVFPIYFENDDDSDRKFGSDSQLMFTAPADGDYLVRVTDVRGFGGKDYHYTLTVRPPKPDFAITIGGANPTVNAGSGRAFSVDVDRIDGFDGEIQLDIANLPPGLHVTTPIVVEAGQIRAWGAVYAEASAVNYSKLAASATVTASAVINGEKVSKEIANGLGRISVTQAPDAFVSLTPYGHPAPQSVDREWQPLAIVKAIAEHASTLTVSDDGSVLAGGENPENESYTVTAEGTSTPIVALRLNVLGDSSLPAKAPGRAQNGNFVLSEVKIGIASENVDEVQPVKIAFVGADYSQKGLDAQGLIDGNDKTGWAIAQEQKDKKYLVKRAGDDPSHFAVFELAEPLRLADNQRLVFTLDQKSENKHHNLGKFQLAATSQPAAARAIEPAVIEIFAGQTIEATLRVDRQAYQGRVGFEARNLPHGVIVDNIGLNGVLITEDKSERTIYLTAYHWVPETERLFYLESNEAGKQCTLPVLLRVKRRDTSLSQR